ncbi:MAG: hypothetical protein V2B14_02350 [bacterium]
MLLQFDDTFIIIVISFVIFMIIMQRIFYAPMLEVQEERKNYIDNNKNSVQKNLDEAQKLKKHYEEKIIQSKIEATNIVSEFTSKATGEKINTLKEVTEKITEKINAEKEKILQEKDNVKEALKPQVASFGNMISAKILGEEISLSGITSEMIEKIMKK